MFDFLLRPIRRRYGKDREFYAAIDDMFGFIPNNIELYKLALIHKSASVELEDGSHINNERLEFLGDAVIESVTSDYLFIEYPEYDEGRLTQLRSKIVSRQSLNGIAKKLGLSPAIVNAIVPMIPVIIEKFTSSEKIDINDLIAEAASSGVADKLKDVAGSFLGGLFK